MIKHTELPDLPTGLLDQARVDRPIAPREERHQADWMPDTGVDDDLLELILACGHLTPAGLEEYDGPPKNHASRRCSTLVNYGLLVRVVDGGLYRISELGLRYLAGRVNANQLRGPGSG